MKDALKCHLIKYCPCCKKEVAVQMNGNNITSKKIYKCKICKTQFVDRKYPIEIRSVAVRFYNLGYSYRAIAKVFNVAPNTIRSWVKSNTVYKILDKSQIKILKNYKIQCKKLRELKEKLQQLLNTLRIRRIGKDIRELENNLVKPDWSIKKRERLISERNRLYDEKQKLGKIKYNSYSVKRINQLLLETETALKTQNEIKDILEAQTVFAREQYNLDEIIKFLEKIA